VTATTATTAHLAEVLAFLAEIQSTTAPIELSIGGVSATGQVRHDVVVVHAAPPKVVNAIVERFALVCLDRDGLHISVPLALG